MAGAIGARELEKKHEKHQEKKRRGDPYGDRPSHHRRRSSGGPLGELKDKIGGFLNPDDKDSKRRSKSHVGSSQRSRGYDDGYDDHDDGYDRRGYRDDRRGNNGVRRRDDYY